MTHIATPVHMDQDELIKLVNEKIDNMGERVIEPIVFNDKLKEHIKIIEKHREDIIECFMCLKPNNNK